MKLWVKWTLVVIVIVALLGLSILPWYYWGKPDVNAESQQKAQELHDLAVQNGLNVPSVDTLEQIYGSDGGYGVQVASGFLKESALLYTNSSTGEIVDRPTLAEAKHIAYSLLVMKVYAPDVYWNDILPYIKDLKIQNEDELPDWLRQDLDQVG